jgi:hypothetical protein
VKVSSLAEKSTIPPTDRVLVSENDAATMLSVSKPTFRKYVAAGAITQVALPDTKRNLYRISDLRAFADSLGARSQGGAE